MELSGMVTRSPIARGSKSERVAVMFVTSEGEFVLRRQGGHPLQDDTLDLLVGRKISAEGHVNGQYFNMIEWKELQR